MKRNIFWIVAETAALEERIATHPGEPQHLVTANDLRQRIDMLISSGEVEPQHALVGTVRQRLERIAQAPVYGSRPPPVQGIQGSSLKSLN